MIVPSALRTSWCCKVHSRSRLFGLAGGLWLAAGLAATTLSAASPAQTSAAAEKYVIIVSQDVALGELSLEELRRLFLFKRLFWTPGKPVRLILPATGQPARSFLLDKVYQRSEGDLRRLILESMYRGETDQAPRMVAGEAEILNVVGSSTGAISLVSSDAALPAAVKALKIDGKLPSDAGYPLGP